MPRFYKEELPELESIVIIRIQSIGEDAVYGEMLEYDNMEAMIPTSEIYIKRYRSVKDYLRIGMNVPAQVIRIDGSKIDLSLKHVQEEEGAAAMAMFKRAYKADHIIRVAAKQDPGRILEFYQHIWALSIRDVYGYFEDVRRNGGDVPPEILAIIQQKIQIKSYVAEKEIILRFGKYSDGVVRLSSELNRIASLPNVSVLVISPPKYKISVSASSQTEADARLAEILKDVFPAC